MIIRHADWRMRALRVVGIAFAVFGMTAVFIITTLSFLAWVMRRMTPVDVWLWLMGPK